MKLTQQYFTVPVSWHECPKKKGQEIIISDNITFKDAILEIEKYCKGCKNFHYYCIKILDSTYKLPMRMQFTVYILDPLRKFIDTCEVSGFEDVIPPYVDCIFTIYNNDSIDSWCKGFNIKI